MDSARQQGEVMSMCLPDLFRSRFFYASFLGGETGAGDNYRLEPFELFPVY
ncbi:MAG: hypothetical protein KJ069_23195 [Anaerolineae bacterium]|nr:hypothetical protein [Anaerolineae bacterium]